MKGQRDIGILSVSISKIIKGRGGKAGRGRERMVPLLSHSMILPLRLIVAAHAFLHIFLAFLFSLLLARFQ